MAFVYGLYFFVYIQFGIKIPVLESADCKKDTMGGSAWEYTIDIKQAGFYLPCLQKSKDFKVS